MTCPELLLGNRLLLGISKFQGDFVMSRFNTVTFRGRHNKLTQLSNLYRQYLSGRVLDVGCDAKYLETVIDGRYIGVDIHGSPDVVINLEQGLPFHSKTFSTIVALDIIEHCDNIHFAVDELFRVADRNLIIGIPNMYEWHFRLLYLLGRTPSGKYGLQQDPPSGST